MAELPWLDYSGQTTAELLACKESHRIDSLICAFEEGIQAKGEAITEEERLVLAVKGLEREVNNGGYDQFFHNSSRRFVPIIVESLRQIGCEDVAQLTAKAIGNAGDAAILDGCDREFYALSGIAENLFRFVEAHQEQIQLVKALLPPKPKLQEISTASKLYIRVSLLRRDAPTLEAAREITRQNSEGASEQDIEAVAALFAFAHAVKAGDLAACEQAAPLALQLMSGDTSHCILQRRWAELAIAASRWGTADAATLTYLKYLQKCDQATLSTQNRVLYWAVLLQKYPGALPKSEEFFQTAFPEEDLGKPLPKMRFKPR
ncbi:MAG TPA: DUF4375 domain-containing protein [Candidatus Sulfopaludibacter sp.]|nr:DUF4375 domain-containing protein [Candidatus Sulfopaludibacter sp.]